MYNYLRLFVIVFLNFYDRAFDLVRLFGLFFSCIKFIFLMILNKHPHYKYKTLNLKRLNNEELLIFLQKYDLHQKAKEINEEYGITETDNYLICRMLYRNLLEGELDFFYNYFKLSSSNSSRDYNRTYKGAMVCEFSDTIYFVHFSSQEIIITHYPRYFHDPDIRQVEVIALEDIEYLRFYSMYSKVLYLLNEKEKMLYIRLRDGQEYCLNFFYDKFRHHSSFDIFLSNFEAFTINNGENCQQLLKHHFYLSPQQVVAFHFGDVYQFVFAIFNCVLFVFSIFLLFLTAFILGFMARHLRY